VNVLDLFSGIGGFSLGLERAGMRTREFVEKDVFCVATLARHWPNTPIHDDVRTFHAPEGYADVICGGFPCQDVSQAGLRRGIEGERSGLWKEYARIIGEVRPRYVIVENVAALLGLGMGIVLGDLAALGFDAEWHCIPACAVNAPHVRDRIWIIAYPHGERLQGRLDWGALIGTETLSAPEVWDALPASFITHGNDGLPRRVVRDWKPSKALGNAVVPQIAEVIGRAIMKNEFAAQREVVK
jgi:DNA (cytosine-5)-methyltransferase 1